MILCQVRFLCIEINTISYLSVSIHWQKINNPISLNTIILICPLIHDINIYIFLTGVCPKTAPWMLSICVLNY